MCSFGAHVKINQIVVADMWGLRLDIPEHIDPLNPDRKVVSKSEKSDNEPDNPADADPPG